MPLLREISKNNEKESHKTTGSVQAYTDAKTRDREEKEYYNSDSARKWLLNRFSSKEIDLLKKEFGISSDNRLKAKVESMSDYDLDVLLHRLKNPAKPAYPEYQKPDDTKKPPTTPTVPSTPKPPTTLPEIIKPSQLDPNKIADTGTGGLSAFQAAKNTKHISGVDYNYLISYFNGNTSKAQDAVIKLKEEKLREMIDAQKGLSGYTAGQLGEDNLNYINRSNDQYSSWKNKYPYNLSPEEVVDLYRHPYGKHELPMYWIGELIEKPFLDAKEFVENQGEGIKQFKDFVTERYDYDEQADKVESQWDNIRKDIDKDFQQQGNSSDSSNRTAKEISDTQTKLERTEAALRESERLWKEKNSIYESARKEIEEGWKDYNIRRELLDIEIGIKIAKIVTAANIKEAILKEIVGEYIEESLIDLVIAELNKLDNVDLTWLQELRGYKMKLSEIDKEYYTLKNKEKKLPVYLNAYLAIDKIHRANVDKVKALETRLSELNRMKYGNVSSGKRTAYTR